MVRLRFGGTPGDVAHASASPASGRMAILGTGGHGQRTLVRRRLIGVVSQGPHISRHHVLRPAVSCSIGLTIGGPPARR
jgi:hypothetical protein